MAVQYRQRGKGFGQRFELALGVGSARDRRDTLNELKNERALTFEARVADEEHLARCYLADEGHDPDSPDLKRIEEDTDADYACRLLNAIRRVREALNDGKAESAAVEAWTCGMLFREWMLKHDWEPSALIRARQRKAFNEARDLQNRNRREDRRPEWQSWQMCADDLWRKHPCWGARSIAERVKHDLALSASVETIRKRIRKSG